ncbi:MAG TPA: helix-turn-helix domain-containing protein [Pirellulales bacterium]|jgi:hypothetical protein|nr:helix-turn-helix domain-containing protein [Pirellulales bacterium]
MASKLVPLNDAAAHLGVTPEELSEMRQRGDVYGYRDGASWKFKVEDLDAYKAKSEGGSGLGSDVGLSGLGLGGSGLSALGIKPDAIGGESAASGSDLSSSAGGSGLGISESDIGLGGSGIGLADSGLGLGSDLGGSKPGSLGGGDEEVVLLGGDDDAGEASGSSTVVGKKKAKPTDAEAPKPAEPKPAAPKPAAGKKDSSDDILAGAIGAAGSSSDLQLGPSDLLTGSDVLVSAGGSNLGGSSIFGGSSNVLGGESQIVINPSESQVAPEIAESPTVIKKGSDPSLAAGSGLELSGDDDDIFGGPKSDVTHRPGDSGILLIDPGDSGLSLDQPLDLAGSGVGGASGIGSAIGAGKGSLETTEFHLGAEEGASLQADDDFLLTPLEETAEDESDSGSQVIMLDTEGEGDFGEATATLLSTQIPGLLEEESSLGALGGAAAGGAGTATAAAPGMVMVPAVRETPFPGWMVMLLAVCILTLGLSGAMAYDLVRNMWSWEQPYTLNSTLMDLIVGK